MKQRLHNWTLTITCRLVVITTAVGFCLGSLVEPTWPMFVGAAVSLVIAVGYLISGSCAVYATEDGLEVKNLLYSTYIPYGVIESIAAGNNFRIKRTSSKWAIYFFYRHPFGLFWYEAPKLIAENPRLAPLWKD